MGGRTEVGRDGGHLFEEIGVELLAVLSEFDHAGGEGNDVPHVERGGVLERWVGGWMIEGKHGGDKMV